MASRFFMNMRARKLLKINRRKARAREPPNIDEASEEVKTVQLVAHGVMVAVEEVVEEEVTVEVPVVLADVELVTVLRVEAVVDEEADVLLEDAEVEVALVEEADEDEVVVEAAVVVAAAEVAAAEVVVVPLAISEAVVAALAMVVDIAKDARLAMEASGVTWRSKYD